MTLEEVMAKLESLGNPATRDMYRKHGAPEPMFGVKVADLKTILKQTRKDHALALQLYATGNVDAMYLAGLMADERRITVEELRRWADAAVCYAVGEYPVSQVAAESAHGLQMAREWIDDARDHVAAMGWSTYALVLSLRPDERLDLAEIRALLSRVEHGIQQAPNRVRYTMNGFVIAVGTWVAPLGDEAMRVARAIGKVRVDFGTTSCKVPAAPEYIEKVRASGKVGRKRKAARC